jgi:hypothetical protein
LTAAAGELLEGSPASPLAQRAKEKTPMSGSSKMYPEGKGGVKTTYEGGVMVLHNEDGGEIVRYDPVNKKLIVPSGATLQLNSGCVMQVGSGGLPTSDPSVAGAVWAESGTLKVSAG